MAGALDKTLAAVAKTVVSDLGAGLNTDISFLKQSGGTYNVATGEFDSTQTSYFFKAPIEFIDAEEEEGREEQAAKIYIAPDQIGGSYPDLDDQIVLFDVEEFLGTQAGLRLKTQSNDNLMLEPLSGSGNNCQITGIRMYGGGQEYLYVIQVRF